MSNHTADQLPRRTFLAAAGAMAVGGPSVAASPSRYPFAALDDAWQAAGFDPADQHSVTFVVAADSHYGQCDKQGIRPIIAHLNTMRPRPAFFLVNGDLINDASRSFGHCPNDVEKIRAIEQFKMFRRDLDQIDPRIERKLTLGNHDTYPGEREPELFHRVFPDAPAYQTFDLAGVKMVALNGHHDGRLDPTQQNWLETTASAFDPDSTVIIFVHQPAMGGVVSGRIGPPIEQAFNEHRGPIWLIGGHVHRNGEQAFALAHTTVAQTSIVCAGAGLWGGPEKPGYWIYGLHHGRVAARVFHRLGHGYRIAPAPDRSNPSPIRRPFESTEGVLWRVMTGENDAPYRVDHEAADTGSWWMYVRQLTYRLPLDQVEGKAARLAILGSRMESVKIELSVEPNNWQSAQASPGRDSVYSVQIPKAWRGAPWCYVRIRAEDVKPIIGGFALLKG